jgi:raffinose/stachyose/melibiose transport system substrate-binding protein
VEPFEVLEDWRPYLPSGFEALKYSDSQVLFTTGQAAIYPAGSWEIQGFNAQAGFKMGAFPPPVKNEGDQCYINDHTDIALGLNAKTEHPEEAREFLQWMTTKEFAELYGNLLPGFFPLYNGEVELSDPLANEIIGWRQNCESTIRVTYQILSRGEPNFDLESYRVTVGVLNGTISPVQAGEELQNGMDQWYPPE